MVSNVVNRRKHLRHSRLLRIAFASAAFRESVTLVSSCPQNGHRIQHHLNQKGGRPERRPPLPKRVRFLFQGPSPSLCYGESGIPRKAGRFGSNSAARLTSHPQRKAKSLALLSLLHFVTERVGFEPTIRD